MVKMIIAGVESAPELIEDVGGINLLTSFASIDKKTLKLIDGWDDHLTMLDSGAHTLQNKQSDEVDFDEFFENYKKFVKKHKDKFNIVVELDIDEQVGYERVKEYRRELEKITQIMPVHHPERGEAEWREVCDRYDYVGTQTVRKGIPKRYIRRLLGIAEEYDTKVHGFGFSEPIPLIHLFYSVDSTTWKNGSKYGMFYIFENGELHFYHDGYKEFQEKYGRSFSDLDYKQQDKWNLLQWKKFSEYLGRMD